MSLWEFQLFRQICEWLEEENIEFKGKENDLTLKEGKSGNYNTKRWDVFTKDDERLFSIVPYGIWIIGAEGRVELEGDSGTESFIYLIGSGASLVSDGGSEKDNILYRQVNGIQGDGWHWLDERIIGKKPLLNKDIFLALLERIN